jgi:hypothetical protein
MEFKIRIHGVTLRKISAEKVRETPPDAYVYIYLKFTKKFHLYSYEGNQLGLFNYIANEIIILTMTKKTSGNIRPLLHLNKCI